jgi:hypothetical protein
MLGPIGFEEVAMAPEDRDVSINMSGISVSGVGGLGLVAVAGLITYVLPQAWWLVAFGGIGGIALGCAMVGFRRHHLSSGPSGDDPKILFRAEAPVPNRPPARTRTRTLEFSTFEP